MYIYYLTRDFIASTLAFNLLIRTFNLASRAFSLPTRGFELVSRGSELVTRGFELITRGFELVTHGLELVTCEFELVTGGFKLITCMSRNSQLITRVLLFHGCDAVNCEVNLIFLIKPFFKKSRRKWKYLENEKSFQGTIKSIFHHF